MEDLEKENTKHVSESRDDCGERSSNTNSGPGDEHHRGEIKYDPVAQWYYPAPYPRNQDHGGGV